MPTDETVLFGVVLLLVGGVAGAGAVALADGGAEPPRADATTPEDGETDALFTDAGVTQFADEEAFRSYVRRGRALADGGPDFGDRPPRVERDVAPERPVAEGGDGDAAEATPMPTRTPMETDAERGAPADGGDGGAAGPDRVAETNVQVQGIDEPDLVKTDGRHVYYAPGEHPRPRSRHRTSSGDTRVLSVETPADPELVADVEASGQLLLAGDRLVVVGEDELVGYDVSDPDEPERVWTHALGNEVVTARLTDGSVYLVTRAAVRLEDPCPIEPLDGAAPIACSDVYRPSGQTPVDATYSALALDPATGDVEATTSFVGTSDTTAVYMSANALYVTYTERTSEADLRLQFLLAQDDRLPEWVRTRLSEIREYDISAEAKEVEARQTLQQWFRTLEPEDRRRIQRNLHNDYRSFAADHQRALPRTGVVKVAAEDLSVETVGTVPGRPLNQFSLSEHDGTLRITTTVPSAGSAQSVNDLYVLDADTLERRGAETDMGEGQRVYAVRYVGDTAYVVTFRQVDPLHVVDLSDPDEPEELGELKLPGFSTYLHPVDDDRVLGIGEEDGRVKAVLFDVSDPTDPTVADDYVLDERWSAVSESHHAFLLDREHGVFFLPTGEGGQVMDYTDDDLSLTATVETDGPALRARYFDDSLYVFASRELVVVDERTWNRTATLDLTEEP